jgi:CheY-like chemotaxis protein
VTKLLYVEDNDDNVYMLKMRLELLGDFEVVTADNGERGCEMAVAERPDIILMDLEMPIVDGWEATRRLKSNPQTRDIPVIAFSAHALAGEREKALAAGCDEFDTKPIEFDRLVKKGTACSPIAGALHRVFSRRSFPCACASRDQTSGNSRHIEISI